MSGGRALVPAVVWGRWCPTWTSCRRNTHSLRPRAPRPGTSSCSRSHSDSACSGPGLRWSRCCWAGVPVLAPVLESHWVPVEHARLSRVAAVTPRWIVKLQVSGARAWKGGAKGRGQENVTLVLFGVNILIIVTEIDLSADQQIILMMMMMSWCNSWRHEADF